MMLQSSSWTIRGLKSSSKSRRSLKLPTHEPARSSQCPTRISSRKSSQKSLRGVINSILCDIYANGGRRWYSDAAAVFSALDDEVTSTEALLLELLLSNSAEQKSPQPAATTRSEPWISPSMVKRLPLRQIKGAIKIFRDAHLSASFTSDLMMSFCDDGHHQVTLHLALELLRRRTGAFCTLCLTDWLHRLLKIGQLELAQQVLSCFPSFKPEDGFFRTKISYLWSALAWRFSLYDKLDRSYESLVSALSSEHVLHGPALTEMGIRFARAGQIERAEHVFDLLQAKSEGPPESFCYSLVAAYVQLGRPQNAKGVVEAFSKFHDGQSTKLLQSALSSAFASTESSNPETQKLVKMIARQHAQVVNGRGFNWVVDCKGLRGDYEEAYRILQELEQSLESPPNRIQYTTIMHAAAEQADYEYILMMMEDAEEKGLKIDSHMMTALVKALIRAEQVKDAIDVLEGMRENEDELARPTVMSYCITINALRDAGYASFQVEQWLEEDGFGDEVSSEWATLMNVKVQNGDIDGGLRLLNQVRTMRYRLFSLIYLPLIQSYLSSMNFEEGDKLIATMRSDMRRLKSTRAAAVLIDYCFQKGDDEEAKRTISELLESCRASGFGPNDFAVSLIVRSMAEKCTKQEIMDFWVAIKQLDGRPGLAGFSAMIFAMCKFRDKRAASVIVKEAIAAARENEVRMTRRFCSFVLGAVVNHSLGFTLRQLKERMLRENPEEEPDLERGIRVDPEARSFLQHMSPYDLRWLVLDETVGEEVLTQREIGAFSGWFERSFRSSVKHLFE